MNIIDERLKVMNVETSKMSKEQKFSAATGLTFYNENLEKNGWYVPGGSANVSTEPEEEPIVPDPVYPDEEEPVVAGSDEYTDEEPVVPSSTLEPTDNIKSTPSEIEIETKP